MVQHAVDVAGLVQIHNRGVVVEREKRDAVEFHAGRVPVHRIAHRNNAIVGTVRGELERTTGHNIPRVSPGVAEFFNRLLIDNAKKLMRHQADKEWRRLG